MVIHLANYHQCICGTLHSPCLEVREILVPVITHYQTDDPVDQYTMITDITSSGINM